MSTTIAAVKAHPDKYGKDFNAVIAYLSQYIDKLGPALSVKIATIVQTRPAKRQEISLAHGTFKGQIEFKKYSREEYYSMSMA